MAERYKPSEELEGYAGSRLRTVEKVVGNTRNQRRIVEILNRGFGVPIEQADVAVVLGTSPGKPKFNDRVAWAAGLINSGRVNNVVFTGSGDADPRHNVDQASKAREMAISKYGVCEQQVFTAGGKNTEQNIQEAKLLLEKWATEPKTILIVSCGEHLWRAMLPAVDIFRNSGMQVFPEPTNRRIPDDVENPAILLELVKMVAYHRTLFKTPDKFNDPDAKKYLQDQIDAAVEKFQRNMLIQV